MQDIAKKGTDTRQRQMGTQEPPDCPQRATDPDHQQPWDTHARGGSLQAKRSLHPRATPRAARGGGVCPLALRTTRPGSSEPPPPAAPGADLGLWAPGGQARHLILPAGQAGRHKRRSREGRTEEKTDAERQTRKMDRGLTQMDTGSLQPWSPWDMLAISQLPPPSNGPLKSTEILPLKGLVTVMSQE